MPVVPVDARLDPATHDLAYVDGTVALTADEGETIAQRIRIRLRRWRGEWFLDGAAGVDYKGRIFRKGASLSGVLDELRREILGVPGVRRIVQLDVRYDRTTRTLTLSDILVEARAGTVTVEV